MATNKQFSKLVQRTIVSDIRLIYNPKVRNIDRAVVTEPEHAYRLFMDSWDMDSIYLIEQAKLMLLNKANRVLGIVNLSTGGLTATIVDPKMIFMIALQAGATAILLAHNHPSGKLEPSDSDKVLTAKIKDAGKLLDILVIDHLIVSPEGYLSMAD